MNAYEMMNSQAKIVALGYMGSSSQPSHFNLKKIVKRMKDYLNSSGSDDSLYRTAYQVHIGGKYPPIIFTC